MRVAVVGSGIAGLAAARALDGSHEVALFEAAPRAGGHACTVEVDEAALDAERAAARRKRRCEGTGRPPLAVDLGFIVYNRRTYPRFSTLLDQLGVLSAPSSMGFSVSCPRSGFEYAGEGLRGLLARPANLLDPRAWGIVRGQLRFARHVAARLGAAGPEGARPRASAEALEPAETLGELCAAAGLPASFARWYLAPMVGAVWSQPPGDALALPAAMVLPFFRQHGLVDLRHRPRWRTVVGGSARYVERLLGELRGSVHLATPVLRVERDAAGVTLRLPGGSARFAAVVLAVHSDQALRLLATPTAAERAVLGGIAYQDNDVVLHHDTRLLPRRRGAWASWNVRLDGQPGLGVTYWMNALQPLPTRRSWCVTLNRSAAIDPARVAHRARFAHPVLDVKALAAQRRWAEIDGSGGVHYAGAYWRHGFHEDGMWSGWRAATALRAATEAAA